MSPYADNISYLSIILQRFIREYFLFNLQCSCNIQNTDFLWYMFQTTFHELQWSQTYKKLEQLWTWLSFSKNARWSCISLPLLYWTGTNKTLLGSQALKTSRCIVLAVWWVQDLKKRIFLRTSFIGGLLAFLVLSDSSQLLRFMHKKG